MSGVPSAFIGPVVVVLLILFSEYRISAVPSAFILVLDEVDDDDILVLPEGVVIVLDLVMVPEPLVVVLDLLMPAGLVMVLDLVVTLVPGVWVERVVVFDEVLLMVLVAGVAVWACTTELPSRLRETRKPRMRFIIRG